ncbi:replication protein [Azorhizophilus paspali]
MDNELYEALIGADLSGRELRVALAVHRLTAGFNKKSVKVAALYIAKMMYRDDEKAKAERANVSRAINSLIRQRVLFRDGGSRDPITFMPVSEWKIDDKSTVLKSTHCVEKVPASVLKITHIKDSKDNTTTDVVVSAPAEQPAHAVAEKPAEKPKAKRNTFTLSNLLADNPYGVSEQVLSDWLACREKLRAAVTVTVWKRVNAELAKCVAAGIAADDALAEAQEAGWRGFKCEWLLNRNRSSQPRSAGPDFHSGDTSWANDLGPL